MGERVDAGAGRGTVVRSGQGARVGRSGVAKTQPRPPRRGSFLAPSNAGNSSRVLGLFRECPKGVK